jgi:hypothetical protein
VVAVFAELHDALTGEHLVPELDVLATYTAQGEPVNPPRFRMLVTAAASKRLLDGPWCGSIEDAAEGLLERIRAIGPERIRESVQAL